MTTSTYMVGFGYLWVKRLLKGYDVNAKVKDNYLLYPSPDLELLSRRNLSHKVQPGPGGSSGAFFSRGPITS